MSQDELAFSRYDDEAWLSTQFALRSTTYAEVMGHVREAFDSHLKARHHRANIVQIGPETKKNVA